jgi:hypothetical protein
MKTVHKIWRMSHMLWGLALLCLLPPPALAQNARLKLDILNKLSSKAANSSEVNLDGEWLRIAAKFLDVTGDPDAAAAKDLIKDLQGIYVKSFEFDEPNQYSQSDVEEIRAQLRAPGWTRIVQSSSKHTSEHDEIYVMKENSKIIGVGILVAEPKELTVVNIVGPMDLDKLSALAGKFGIPEETHHL